MERSYYFLSWDEDLHVAAAKKLLEEKTGAQAYLINTNKLADDQGATFFRSNANSEGLLPGCKLDDVVWARRVRPLQKTDVLFDTETTAFIHNECSHALIGAVCASGAKHVINDIWRQHQADCKILQLKFAMQAGFKIPSTLVSNSPKSVREFFSLHKQKVIVKVLHGTKFNTYTTIELTEEMLENDSSIRACPAIYQERIEGTKHLRINFFGENAYAFEIESDMMDWRRKLTRRITQVLLPPKLESSLRALKNQFGLHLSVFDLKYDDCGDIFFLELNPQGQYLFLEGLTGFPLNEKMVNYLISL